MMQDRLICTYFLPVVHATDKKSNNIDKLIEELYQDNVTLHKELSKTSNKEKIEEIY